MTTATLDRPVGGGDFDERRLDAPGLAHLAGLIAGHDLHDARTRAEEALARPQQRGDGADLSCALTTLGVIAWREGRMLDALGLLRAAVSRSDPVTTVSGRRSYPRLPLALVLATLGELTLADAAVAECRKEVEWAGDGEWAAAPLVCGAFVSFASGRLREARAETEMAREIAGQHRNSVLTDFAARVRCLVELHDSDIPTAGCNGDPDHGARLRLTVPGMAPALVRATLAAGERERAGQIVVLVERVAAENFGLPALDAAARHARGLLEANVDSLLRSAVEHRHPLARASAHEDAGAILARSDRAAAQGEFECALAAYRHAGADRAANRTRLRLREVSKRSPGRRRDQPRWGWVSLTPTEARVARVVAEGLTNAKVADRMFLSRHTVDFHLRQIYRKLDISSRVELTRLVLENAA